MMNACEHFFHRLFVDDVLTGARVEADTRDRVLAASSSVKIPLVRHAVVSAFSAPALEG